MTAISLVSGVVMVWIFGKVSDQDTIKQLRERIRGNLIGVRLFQSDIGVVLQLQRRIFGDTFSYMRYALVPMVVLLVPVVLIMTQLNLRFAARPLEPGESALIKAYVRDAGLLDGEVSLEVPDGMTVETGAVRIRSAREVAWRVRVDSRGGHRMKVQVGGQELETRLIAGNEWGAVPQRRTGRGMWDTLLYPGEPPIPNDHPVEAVEIVYPPLELGGVRVVDQLAGRLLCADACLRFPLQGRAGCPGLKPDLIHYGTHRGRRGGRPARREEGACRAHVTDGHRRRTGCLDGRMPARFVRWVLVC